jgi:hypothetical protein
MRVEAWIEVGRQRTSAAAALTHRAANPHLLINRLTAVKTSPVGKVWLTK